MVEMIISAVIGAFVVIAIVGLIFGGKIFGKKRLSKKANFTLEEQKTEALIKAVILMSRTNGTEYSKPILALKEFEIDEDQLANQALLARANKGKIGNAKITKKAKKVKL